MKKLLFILICLFSTTVYAFEVDTKFLFDCNYVGEDIRRCENKETVCYIYDTGWAGFAKSGRGAGISCIKK